MKIIKNSRIYKLYKKYEELVNYVVSGALTTIVSLSSYYACVLTILNPNNEFELQAANIISWILSVIFAFIVNKFFVFKSKSDKVQKEFFAFVSARLMTLFVDMFSMFLMVSFLSINDKIAKLIVQVIVLIINYVMSKFLVFKKIK